VPDSSRLPQNAAHRTEAAGTLAVPISPGELLDKISILEIKLERIAERAKRENVRHELEVLSDVRKSLPQPADLTALTADLKAVNEHLWEIEDAIRDCERHQEFGRPFVELARSVYRQNDRRAALKRQINELLGSRLIEEKAYAPY
jgi:3-methyladenine DNA glycosylase/8-oxoguanine DNA glycosylase